MTKVPLVVNIITGIASVFHLLSAMFLLSSIISWISLEFSGPLPHALGFIVGILSLLNAVIGILLIGASQMRRSMIFVFLIVTTITLLASLALLIPFAISYSNFCSDCSEMGQTLECVAECNDECCFTALSRPLAVIFIVFTTVTLLSSLVGVGVAVPYLWYAYASAPSKQH